MLEKALIFDELKGQCAVGANIRYVFLLYFTCAFFTTVIINFAKMKGEELLKKMDQTEVEGTSAGKGRPKRNGWME